jgi:F1F0 ATPase subunit 2
MLNENLYLTGSLLAGILLGFVFYGGLWITTRKIMTAKSPFLWVTGSFILRTGIILAGFYFVSGGNWNSLLICLIGFIVARLLTTCVLPSNNQDNSTTEMETKHET